MNGAVPAVLAQGLTRRYRGGRGLGPVHLRVLPGECVGIIGRNGAGKSTLLRLLASIDRPQAGRVAWYGSTSARRLRPRLGLALDSIPHDETLSARQSAYFWCRQWVRDREAARTMVDELLERFGLDAVAGEPVGAYSLGMRRRLALIEALAHRPQLMLLDEPTAALDTAGCSLLASLLRARCAGGGSAVVASNDPGFVARACSRAHVLVDGRFSEHGVAHRSDAAAPGLAELNGCLVEPRR